MKTLVLMVLSLCVLAAYFFTGYTIITHQTAAVDAQTSMLIGTVYGSIASLAGAVVAYWFGSSRGSSEKDQALKNLSTKGETL
jgi:hypothetical protein